ncbi:RagB/SusD family nutrient uptake outer membrane protein [Sphingobacterium paucimobilis]|uniref:RagB/SusD family nutrient uptake outer membrane protein n=1 Tax=Sphingobacterium paucimobilis HER1398 TaxID=1346330 RepID=U2HUS8_9SPHI|nr:RagB/SusD family nutrient uptake outer membrane protein [Sphingobacterium paucimobilis]ERJ59277.1 hypothetical protein M472_10875 [Sphingobacterium paucimobilis HER1398]
MKEIIVMWRRLLYVVTGLLVLSSCDDYLDIKSSTNMALVSTLEDVEAILDNTQIMNYRSPCMGESSADDIYIPNPVYDRIVKAASRDIYVWKNADYEQASNPWGISYETIFYANVCLKTLDEMAVKEGEKNRWNRAKGAALVFRANSFLRAIWIWSKAYDESTASSDLGIVLKTNPDVNERSVRASVAESFEKVIVDLKAAMPLLPHRSDLPVRPSKVAVYGLLSRAYLSMRDYANAEKYADSCLTIQNDLLDFNTDIKLPTATSSVNPFTIFNKEVIFSTAIGLYAFPSSTTYAVIDTNLINSYQTDDLRRFAFFRNTANGAVMRGNFSINSTQYFTGVSTAEMWLTKAECLVRRGQIREGLTGVDNLLKRRYKVGTSPYLDMGMDRLEALQLVLLERRKELVTRNLRWMDIKRLNKEGANIILTRLVNGETYTLPPNDDRYALPLPSDVIRLTGMPQN